jgi:hypothetical protein
LAKSVRDASRFVASNATVGSTGVVVITPELRTQAANLVVTGRIGSGGTPLLSGLTSSNVAVSDVGAGFIAVTATYTYQPILGATLPKFGFGSNPLMAIPLTARTTMRVL